MTTTKTRTGAATLAPPVDVPEDDGADPYLAATDVADLLGIHRSHAWRLMSTGVIPEVLDLSSGGERAALRVRASDLDAWLTSRHL